ncbi:M50 family metallopeptidase [Candidatus Woesearchaeota archaeon]|nr:M50 family metallopeptidase [Candidatus Woesearchaeota archaeon]
MVYLSLHELVDIVVMTLILGFLFKDAFRPRMRVQYADDPVAHYARPRRNKWRDFWFATAAVAPAVILHELAHKFVAMGYGLQATFHAFYANTTTLFLGVFAIIAKMTGLGFIFLVPGYVEIMGNAAPLQYAIIAFAGPAVHALFWIGALIVQKTSKNLTSRQVQFVHLTKYINGFLFVLNMLPIPGIDGFAVYSSLGQVLL